MKKIRQITRTTDGQHIGKTFDLNEVNDRIELDGTIFVVYKKIDNKIISNNYIVEFGKAKGIEDE